MRQLVGLLALVTLGLALAACGSSSGHVPPGLAGSSATEPNFSTHHNDRDNDGDHNDDDGKVLFYGHAADASDQRASSTLVRSYFAAAAAENGAQACALLAPFVAESVPEEDGHSPQLRGKTCTVVMSKLFKLHHKPLAAKSASLQVIAVRVEDQKALVVLDFPNVPEVRQIAERRIAGTWRLLDLLDGILE
jgi:hypothetical protein